jgi:hypothetical protein
MIIIENKVFKPHISKLMAPLGKGPKVQNNDLEKTISLLGDRDLFLQIVVLHLRSFLSYRVIFKLGNSDNS